MNCHLSTGHKPDHLFRNVPDSSKEEGGNRLVDTLLSYSRRASVIFIPKKYGLYRVKKNVAYCHILSFSVLTSCVLQYKQKQDSPLRSPPLGTILIPFTPRFSTTYFPIRINVIRQENFDNSVAPNNPTQ